MSLAETKCARRGFRVTDTGVRRRLEEIGARFLHGYEAAVEDDDPAVLAASLRDVEPDDRGFAFEGAGMALALRDALTPWRRDRLRAFLSGPGAPYTYLVHVGAGWARARLRAPLHPPLRSFDPMLRWLVLDGYGFHEGYFRWQRSIARRVRTRRLRGYALRAFDQGLGRALWFVEGADPERIAAAILGFPEDRRADLWSGVGLACAYAGGVVEETVRSLLRHAGAFAGHLAQGAAFAAEARAAAGNPAACTERACGVLCGTSAAEAAARARRARAGGSGAPDDLAYEGWRVRTRQTFDRQAAPVEVVG